MLKSYLITLTVKIQVERKKKQFSHLGARFSSGHVHKCRDEIKFHIKVVRYLTDVMLLLHLLLYFADFRLGWGDHTPVSSGLEFVSSVIQFGQIGGQHTLDLVASPISVENTTWDVALQSRGTSYTRAHTHIHTHTHAYTHIYTHIHTHTHTHTYRHTHIHTHTHLQAHQHIHTHTHTHTHTHSHTHTLTGTHTYTHTHTHTLTGTSTHTHTHKHTHTHVNTNTRTHTHTHTHTYRHTHTHIHTHTC